MPKTRSRLTSARYYDYNREIGGKFNDDTETFDGWEEAFKSSGDRLDDRSRWEHFAVSFGNQMTEKERQWIMRGFNGGQSTGYVMTSNSFEINGKLYNPANHGKSDEEIFTRTNSAGQKIDLLTVRYLDQTIARGSVPKNAVYTRFTGWDAIKSTFKLSDAQMSMLRSGRTMSASDLKTLNDAMRGSRSHSRSYTSASGNRQMNVFRSSPIERKLYAPKGTKALGVVNNPTESEIVFGRNLRTELMRITVGKDGHIVFHERVLGYKK